MIGKTKLPRRLLAIFIAVLLMIPASLIGVFADEEGNEFGPTNLKT